MIVIYSENISNRLIYSLNVVFNHVLKTTFKIVNLETFDNSKNQVRVNYSSKNLKDCISIIPHKILFETDINKQKIKPKWIEDVPYFFKTCDNSLYGFDIFASTFFMVSRYEEYFPKNLDNHYRFKAEDSFAFKNNFLELPVVNLWALNLKKEIANLYPDYNFPQTKYKYINSIDIDIAYAYKGKGIFRLFAGFTKSVLTLNKSELKNRLKFILKKHDIYNSYDFINKIQEKYNTTNHYFINLGDYAKFDKNLHHKTNSIQQLIASLNLNNKNQIGIHPSYASNKNPLKIGIEKKRLEKITNQKITNSRQHFLMLSFPSTYENLLKNNISHDYTMGYASKIGFRAGICSTFPFFNILKNEEEDLLITPFQIMDGTLNHYEKLKPEQAIKKINKIINSIKKVNGSFVSLWHNSSLSETNDWENWTIVYEKLVEEASKH
ncbi:polysaccharide deacetylase family protein [Lutibacter citreus]|uniref:polysaccharide deacetylase family protein n=1 Tax=Lutibacter citreus TaxID=2138210 RepID=UPI000DBE366F|nr:polysaccharide deacetylase family protein [Lutibacter citreus]